MNLVMWLIIIIAILAVLGVCWYMSKKKQKTCSCGDSRLPTEDATPMPALVEPPISTSPAFRSPILRPNVSVA